MKLVVLVCYELCVFEEVILLRIRAFVAKPVSLQLHAFLGLFGADFYPDI